MVAFTKEDIFPKIANIISTALEQHSKINRDQIAAQLINLYPELIRKSSLFYKNQSLVHVAGNMVDWFSADLTNQTPQALQWQGLYERKKEKINGRNITVYKFSEYLLSNEESIANPSSSSFSEGRTTSVLVNKYERNILARRKCIQIYGYKCECCNFDFGKVYGDIGMEYIHIHHKIPLSEIRQEYQVNPATDLIPVCANCHAMIHRRNPPFTIEEIQSMLGKISK